jgi:hypothetical protein
MNAWEEVGNLQLMIEEDPLREIFAQDDDVLYKFRLIEPFLSKDTAIGILEILTELYLDEIAYNRITGMQFPSWRDSPIAEGFQAVIEILDGTLDLILSKLREKGEDPLEAFMRKHPGVELYQEWIDSCQSASEEKSTTIKVVGYENCGEQFESYSDVEEEQHVLGHELDEPVEEDKTSFSNTDMVEPYQEKVEETEVYELYDSGQKPRDIIETKVFKAPDKLYLEETGQEPPDKENRGLHDEDLEREVRILFEKKRKEAFKRERPKIENPWKRPVGKNGGLCTHGRRFEKYKAEKRKRNTFVEAWDDFLKDTWGDRHRLLKADYNSAFKFFIERAKVFKP